MAQIKSYDTFQNVKDHIKKGRILSKGAELTVSSAGAITVTDSYHLVKGATDQDALTDILGGTQAGQVLVLQNADDSKDVVVTHGAGKIVLAGSANVTLDKPDDNITLIYTGSKWLQIAATSIAND
tara:strand:- start:79 stop:456 length:378 start_codon:yes stop_codon:yes gene_type:complete